MAGKRGAPCVLDKTKICDECGECSRCDLDPSKQCDNCMRCVSEGSDYRAIRIDGFALENQSGSSGPVDN